MENKNQIGWCDAFNQNEEKFLCKTTYDESQETYEPYEVQMNGEWVFIEEFEELNDPSSYSNYRPLINKS